MQKRILYLVVRIDLQMNVNSTKLFVLVAIVFLKFSFDFLDKQDAVAHIYSSNSFNAIIL